jgi:hypothetical protein
MGERFMHEAPIVVSAIGTLGRPSIPKSEGVETFQGKTFHSARWDDSLEVKNKNIVVLRNGASATQFVPELVKQVGPKGKVTQLVRSARMHECSWCSVGGSHHISSFAAGKLDNPFVSLLSYRYALVPCFQSEPTRCASRRVYRCMQVQQDEKKAGVRGMVLTLSLILYPAITRPKLLLFHDGHAKKDSGG